MHGLMKCFLGLCFSIFINSNTFCNVYSTEFSDTLRFARSDNTGTDSTEYEVVVFDTGYETFLLMQPPKEFYSITYYKNWNWQYAEEWNSRTTSQGRTGLYMTYIDYNHNTDYGLEVEYRLYYFFRYFEKSNEIKLLPRGR